MSEPSPTSDEPEGLHRPAATPTWRERLGRIGDAMGVEITPVRVAIAAVVVAAGVLVAFVALRPPAATTPESVLPLAEPPAAVDPTTSTVGANVLAHAAGAVVAPGVYQLTVGSRVADLVAAAGGATADADLNRVNLAAPVEDGQQIYVPRIGEEAAGGSASGPGGGHAAPSTDSGAGASDGRIDINTASVERLDELPGVGPAIAQAIVTYREEHGPFADVEELLEVPGIGDAKLAQLRDLVSV